MEPFKTWTSFFSPNSRALPDPWALQAIQNILSVLQEITSSITPRQRQRQTGEWLHPPVRHQTRLQRRQRAFRFLRIHRRHRRRLSRRRRMAWSTSASCRSVSRRPTRSCRSQSPSRRDVTLRNPQALMRTSINLEWWEKFLQVLRRVHWGIGNPDSPKSE